MKKLYWIILVIGICCSFHSKNFAQTKLYLSLGTDYYSGLENLNQDIAKLSTAIENDPSNQGGSISPMGPMHFGIEGSADFYFQLFDSSSVYFNVSFWSALAFTSGSVEFDYIFWTTTQNYTVSFWTVGVDIAAVCFFKSWLSVRWGVGLVGGVLSADKSEYDKSILSSSSSTLSGPNELLLDGISVFVGVRMDLDPNGDQSLEASLRYINIKEGSDTQLVSPVFQLSYSFKMNLRFLEE